MEKNQKIQFIDRDTSFPCLVIDNWYSEEEEKDVWKELEFVTSKEKFYRSENTITAKYASGQPKGFSYRTYIDSVYRNGERDSSIIKLRKKMHTDEFYDTMDKAMPHARNFRDTTHTSNLISYYEDGDYYDVHYDAFLFTILIWFYKQPKMYDGGNLILKDNDTEVISKHNRMIVFPCYYHHQVTPIKWINQPNELGYGRYTLTHFHYTVPKGKIDE